MGSEQGEIEYQPINGRVDTVTSTAKNGRSATTRNCGQRTIHKEYLLFFLAGFVFACFTILLLFPDITMFVKSVKTQDLSETADAEVNDKKVNFTGINNNTSTTTCARRYLLLTSARSGSTWTCDLLNLQEGISCGVKTEEFSNGEVLHGFKGNRTDAEIEWPEFEQDLNNGFDKVCKGNPSLSIGFKLMYASFPKQFLDGKLENYLRENNVSVIHLVREAKILKICQTAIRVARIVNEKDVTQLRDTPKFSWTEKTITKMLKLENESLNWQRKLQFMLHVPVYYLNYEGLLNEKDRMEAFRQVSAFLTNTIPDSSSIATDGNLFQQHESLCSDRIEDYENFRNHERVRESRSAAACDMIELLMANVTED